MLKVSLLLLASLGVAGCNSTYLPKGPRISVVLHEGSPAFVREGRLVEHGFFGGGLVEVVEGNPRAEEEAEAYRDLNTTSFGLLMGGLGTVTVSPFILLGSLASSSDQPSDGVFAASLGTATVGLGLVIAGLAVQLSSQPKLYDAINLFNMEVDAREAASRPPPPPPPREFVAPLPAMPVAPPPVAPPPDAPPPEPAPAPPPEPFGPRR